MGRQLFFFALDCLNTGNFFILFIIILDRVMSGVNGWDTGIIHGLVKGWFSFIFYCSNSWVRCSSD